MENSLQNDLKQKSLTRFFNIASGVVLAASILSAIFNFFISYNLLVGVVAATIAIVTAVNIACFTLFKKLSISISVLCLIVILVLPAAIFNFDLSKNTLAWENTAIVVIMLLAGKKRGAFFSIALIFLVAIYAVLTPAVSGLPLVLSTTVLGLTEISMIATFLILYFFLSISDSGEQFKESSKISLEADLKQHRDAEENLRRTTDELAGKTKYLEDTKMAMLNLMEDLDADKQKIAEEKNKLATLIETLPVGVSVADSPSGKLRLINKIGQEMLGRGVNPDALKEDYAKIYDGIKPDGSVYPVEEMAPVIAIKTGQVTSKDDVVIKRPDGNKVQLRVTSVPVKNPDGTISTIISTLVDITREKEIDRMKTEFISLASHQLRTPLTAMKWFSEMLLSGDAGELTPEQKKFIQDIDSSNERMIDLVNSLLNISRIESGRLIIDPQPTNLKDLVDELIVELQPKISAKKLHLIVSVNENLPKVNIDPKLIRQVYQNLLTNAIKYTPENGEISIFISEKDNDLISQVTDSGYGIPQNEQDRVFGKFFRATNIVPIETDGTGLGLYLTKSILESSGGSIWFKSEQGKGTTFWFGLPKSGSVAKKGQVTLGT